MNTLPLTLNFPDYPPPVNNNNGNTTFLPWNYQALVRGLCVPHMISKAMGY